MKKQKEKKLSEATICFLMNGDKIMLAPKYKHIGAGKLNGYGGGPEDGETFDECAIRETYEESGGKDGKDGVLTTKEDIEKVAIVDFHNKTADDEEFTCTCHVYLIHKWSGTPHKTDEMGAPRPYSVGNLPEDDLMPADPKWIPEIFKARQLGKYLRAEAWYKPRQESLRKPTKCWFVDNLDE